MVPTIVRADLAHKAKRVLSTQTLAISMNNGLFELENARTLYQEVQKAMVEYSEEPNSRLFLFLVFSLNHLREWIAEKSATAVRNKSKCGEALTAGELFCLEIWELIEFQKINEFCNKGKHFSVKIENTLITSRGFTVSSSCGDSLGQFYYLIDGIDSREIFFPILRKYHEWFTGDSRSFVAADVPDGCR